MFNLFITFLKIGAFTFGGGYAMVPLIQNELVVKQKLLTDEEFLDYLSIAQSYPGVLAVNISVLLGYRLYKIPGVIACVLGATLPSLVIVLTVSYLYFKNSTSKVLTGFFNGVAPVVVALILYSFYTLAKKVDKNIFNWSLIAASFIAVAIFKLSPIYIILAGGVISLCRN